MATISKKLAEKLLQGNGKCKEGSAGYCLVRYQNRTKYDLNGVDLYNPEAEVNCFDYAIFTSRRKYEEFLDSPAVGGVDVLWGSGRFKKDERKRVDDEMTQELMDGVCDFLPMEEEDPINNFPGRFSKER